MVASLPCLPMMAIEATTVIKKGIRVDTLSFFTITVIVALAIPCRRAFDNRVGTDKNNAFLC